MERTMTVLSIASRLSHDDNVIHSRFSRRIKLWSEFARIEGLRNGDMRATKYIEYIEARKLARSPSCMK